MEYIHLMRSALTTYSVSPKGMSPIHQWTYFAKVVGLWNATPLVYMMLNENVVIPN